MVTVTKEITKEIASFVVNTDFENIPTEAITVAKKAILDGIGVAIAGSKEECSGIIADFIEEIEAKETASILGKSLKTSPFSAALANGTMMHALDYDDQNWAGVIHPTAAIFPSVLAVAEEKGIGGKDVLTAYILGLEGAVKLGRGVLPAHLEKGWHPTATLGTIGAAIAAGKVLNLTLDEMRNAIAIAVSEAGGIRGNYGSMTKPFHAGKSASNGVTAALLADRGFTGNKNIIEESLWGFCEVLGEKDKYNLSVIIENLGDPFEILSSGIALKKYPSCFSTHTSIDGVLHLVKKYKIASTNVEKVKCTIHPRRLRSVNRPNVTAPLEAKFSIQYCVAVAVLDEAVTLDHFESKRFPFDVSVREMMNKVEVKGDPQIGADAKEEVKRAGSRVIITLREGREYSYEVKKPLFADPTTSVAGDVFLTNKYRRCCGKVLTGERVTKSIELIDRLERVEDIRDLMVLLCF